MNLHPRRLPGSFIHAIDLGDWFPCWNIALGGKLSSPDFLAKCDPGIAASHTAIRDVPIERLRVSGLPQGVSTPRAAWYVWASAWIRRGGHVGIGAVQPNWLGDQDSARILKIGDIELEFERIRRVVAPEASSRLSSLYLADDSDVGRAHVRRMLGADVLILRVSIPSALRVTRVDTSWFDLYAGDPKEEHVVQYWSGSPLEEPAATWEYLVDGVVEVTDPAGIELIRKCGAHTELMGTRNPKPESSGQCS